MGADGIMRWPWENNGGFIFVGGRPEFPFNTNRLRHSPGFYSSINYFFFSFHIYFDSLCDLVNFIIVLKLL